MKLRAIGDNILCTEADFGDQKTSAGIIVKSTMGKTDGITPRWFKVVSVGPDIDWVAPNQWLYVEYGRWTDGIKVGDETVWKVEPKSCLVVSDEKPENTISVARDFIEAPKKVR